jgi:hypothetical protein
MTAIKRTATTKAKVEPKEKAEPVEVEETISLAEFEKLRAELSKLRDEMNERPAFIPATPEVDKYAERNFEKIALDAKEYIKTCETVHIILPTDPLNPYDNYQYIMLNGMTFTFKKGEEIDMPRPLYEIWKNSYDQTRKAEARVTFPDIMKDEPNAVLNR